MNKQQMKLSDKVALLIIIFVAITLFVHLFFFREIHTVNEIEKHDTAYISNNKEKIKDYLSEHKNQILNTRTNPNLKYIIKNSFIKEIPRQHNKASVIFYNIDFSKPNDIDQILLASRGQEDTEQSSNIMHVFSFKNSSIPALYNAASYWNEEWVGLYLGFRGNKKDYAKIRQYMIEKLGIPENIDKNTFISNDFTGKALWHINDIRIIYDSTNIDTLELSDQQQHETLSISFINVPRAKQFTEKYFLQ